MMDRSGVPLWVHVMMGVAFGGVIAGVVLYALWTFHMRAQLAEAASQLSQLSRAVTVPAPRVVPAQRPAAAPPVVKHVEGDCAPGEVVGVLNGQRVCVSPTGRVTPGG